MSAVADALPFRRHEPSMGPALGLSVAMHVVLIAILFVGVRFQISPPPIVSVELWEPQPPPPAPKIEEKPPPPQVVKPEPEPEVKKPEIVLPDKPKPKPKPEVKKVEPKPKPAPPKRDLAFEKMLKEQAAAEQKQLAQAEQERKLKEMLARQEADARTKALAAWQDKVSAAIRQRIFAGVADAVPGNPEALFEVRFLADGRITDIRMRKSSGNKPYDEEVAKALKLFAIETPGGLSLPKPPDNLGRNVYNQPLLLRFRPHDR